MRVSVQLFARLREIAGTPEFDCDVPAGATVGTVWQAAVSRHGALAELTDAVSCARNEDFAKMTSPVAEGDAIAFLPPVSGG